MQQQMFMTTKAAKDYPKYGPMIVAMKGLQSVVSSPE
jgi:hypothetical protein